MIGCMGLRKPFKLSNRPTYYYEINRKRRSLGTTNKAEATRLFNEIKRLYLAGKIAQITGESHTTFQDFYDQYLEWAEVNRSKKTFQADRLALNQLKEHVGLTVRMDRLGRKDSDKMITACLKRGLKHNSVNNYIRHLRSCFNKAVEWEILKANPFTGVKELRIEKKPPAYLDSAGMSAVLGGIQDVDLRSLIAAYLSTGRRRAELLSLRWDDVDFKRNRYYIRKSKTHLSKWYPFSPAFKSILEAQERGSGRIFSRWEHPDTITHYAKEALCNAGYSHLRLHDLRHSFAVLFIEGGGGLRTLQDLLGHTRYQTTEIYAHLSDDHLAEEIARVKLPLYKIK